LSEAKKQTWAQAVEARAEARAVRMERLRDRRQIVIDLLSDAFGKLPKPLMDSILACDDLDRLRAAILQTRTLTSLDQFTL
jgi:hypothetical protein